MKEDIKSGRQTLNKVRFSIEETEVYIPRLDCTIIYCTLSPDADERIYSSEFEVNPSDSTRHTDSLREKQIIELINVFYREIRIKEYLKEGSRILEIL